MMSPLDLDNNQIAELDYDALTGNPFIPYALEGVA
jgi:hypothetical protein